MFLRPDIRILNIRPLSTLFGLWLGGLALASAQPTIVSTTPGVGATGVAASAPVVFKFSEAMDPDATTVLFLDVMAPLAGPLPVSTVWNSSHIWMTNTPVSGFPTGKMIAWSVDGQNPGGDALDGDTAGYFTTGAGGGSTGDCTNTMGSVTLAKGAMYEQVSAGASVLNLTNPYAFVACSAVACSNWTTTNLSLTLPAGKGSANVPAEILAGRYNMTAIFNDLTALEGSFPNGAYVFNFKSPTGTTSIPMSLPGTLAFPLPAPHVTNYLAAQNINASQPFVLGWDAAPAAVDCVYVEIYGAFSTPALGSVGALTGAARTITIPANTLKSNLTYTGSITFYDLVLTTNVYVNLAYRATTTEFTLATMSPSNPLIITNASNSGGKFSFEMISSPGQNLIIETSTNLAAGSWKELLTTNNPAGRMRVADPGTVSGKGMFYRLRKGS